MATKLAVSHLTKSFGDLEVLRSIDLEIERGEFITLGRAVVAKQPSCALLLVLSAQPQVMCY